ncbi:hypothetical protein AB4520_09375 [Vibrio renipiscarius]|uniref:hypothetical protein n=1 Tax=Vibrio renipiscarius TaxID=1461322 RepID=UPI003551C420
MKQWMSSLVILSLTWSVHADDSVDKYGHLEVERLKSDGWFALLSEVSMVEADELERAFADILKQCKTTHRQSRPKVNECVEHHFDEYLEVPLADLRDWDNQYNLLENKNYRIDEQLKILEKRFELISNKTALTEADVHEIQLIMEQMNALVLEKADVTNQHMEGVLPYIENIINQ